PSQASSVKQFPCGAIALDLFSFRACTMPIQTVAGLVEALGRYPLLEPRQQSELVGLQSRCASAEDLARELVKREWLTSFQSQYLLMGQAQALVLGSYIVLK